MNHLLLDCLFFQTRGDEILVADLFSPGCGDGIEAAITEDPDGVVAEGNKI